MTQKQIEAALGFNSRRGQGSYPNDAKFETKGGLVVGGLRHSSEIYNELIDGNGDVYGKDRVGSSLASDDNGGRYWHCHETDGVKHCTRRVYAQDIVRVAS